MTARQTQIALLVIAVAGAALTYGPRGGLDGITVTKATVVALAAVVALATAAWGAVRNGALELPRHAPALAAYAFGALLVVRTLLADDGIRAVVGAFGRWNGLALYLAGIVLFLVAAHRGVDGARVIVRSLLVTGIVVAVGAIDEAFLGIGPQWGARPGAASTLGNANFLAAWAGAIFALAAATVLDTAQGRVWRIVAGASLPLLLVTLVLSESFQAGYVAAAGLGVVALAWISVHASRPVFLAAAAAGALGAVAGTALTVLGAMQRGPASFLGDSIGVRLRVEYFAAAGRMISDRPLAGIGPGLFSDHYRAYRSEQAATMVELPSNTDAAHNVPLHLLAEWGVLVGLAWLVWAGIVTWLMLRQLRAATGTARIAYAGIAAVWAGYLLQSLISIDTPSLLILGWVAAGLVVAPQVAGHVPWRVGLPWGEIHPKQDMPLGGRLADYGVAAVAALLLWTVTIPYSADLGATGGEVEVSRDAAEGPPAQTGATARAPWETRYWLQLASVLSEQDQALLMQRTVLHAADIAPDRFEVVVNAARVQRAAEEHDDARAFYEHALTLEPRHPDLAIEVAEYLAELGDEPAARDLVDRALAVDEDHERARELAQRW